MGNERKQFENEVIDEVLQWSSKKIYNIFGPFLETVIEDRKTELKKELYQIWNKARDYCHKETGLPFSQFSLSKYFNVNRIEHYKLSEMENIIERLNTNIVKKIS